MQTVEELTRKRLCTWYIPGQAKRLAMTAVQQLFWGRTAGVHCNHHI